MGVVFARADGEALVSRTALAAGHSISEHGPQVAAISSEQFERLASFRNRSIFDAFDFPSIVDRKRRTQMRKHISGACSSSRF